MRNLLIKIWRVVAFLARTLLSLDGIFEDLKDTFSDENEAEKQREKP